MTDQAAEKPTTTRERRYNRRRREIVNAAAAVFAEKGYHGASTTEIAERLDMQQSALYHYFKSKEEALEEVCRLGIAGHLDGLEQIVNSDLTTNDKVRAAILNHLEPLKTVRDNFIVFITSRRHLPPGLRRQTKKMTRRYEAVFEQILKEGIARGELRADLDTRLATLALIGECNSAATWYGHEPGATVERIADTFAELFLTSAQANP